MTQLGEYSGVGNIDFQIRYAGTWYSMNDGYRYKIHPEGFGRVQHSKRRAKVSSSYFSGEFVISEAENNTDEVLSVWVYGESPSEVEENKDFLLEMFDQPGFVYRKRVSELLVTRTSSGSADVGFDQSHAYLHSNMALATIGFSVLPGSVKELLL